VAAALICIAVAVAVVGGTATPVVARQAEPAFEVVLLRISPGVGPKTQLGYRVAVRNRGQAPLHDLRVTARLGEPVDTRSELASLLAIPGGPAAGPRLVDEFRPTAADLDPGATRQLEPRRVAIPPELGSQRAGVVLPLSIEVHASAPTGQVSARLGTFVVHLPARAAQPLRAALLVPVHEPTHRNPAGDFVDDELSDLLDPGGSLGAVAAELAGPGAPPATMVVDALLVEEATAMVGGWRLLQGGKRIPVPPGDPRSQRADQFLQRLKAAASGHRPAAFPYANADLPALLRAGPASRVGETVQIGRDLLEDGLGTSPDEALAWPVDGAVDGAMLQTLDRTGSDVVVLDPRHLPAPSTGVTQNATVDLGGGGPQPQRALVGDAALSAALTDPRATTVPAEWAQRVLAETAVAWLERPNSSGPRGVLLAPPQSWRPHPAFFRALVRGLAAASWLRLQPAAALATDVPQGPDEGERRLATVTAADVAAGLPRSYLNRVEQVRSELASFRRAVGAEFGPTAGVFDHDLLIAESSDWRPAGARARGRSFVRAVEQGIKGVYRRVQVGTTPVTLTARRGTIPITVVNDSSERITVVLRLTSPKVDLPTTSQPFVLEPRRRTTQLLPVGTRATGTFPIRVDVLTPDGSETIAGGEIRLISTAINRVALALTGGAAGILLLWWRVRLRRRAGTGTPR
jgi:uncharacterized protein DUF6049